MVGLMAKKILWNMNKSGSSNTVFLRYPPGKKIILKAREIDRYHLFDRAHFDLIMALGFTEINDNGSWERLEDWEGSKCSCNGGVTRWVNEENFTVCKRCMGNGFLGPK